MGGSDRSRTSDTPRNPAGGRPGCAGRRSDAGSPCPRRFQRVCACESVCAFACAQLLATGTRGAPRVRVAFTAPSSAEPDKPWAGRRPVSQGRAQSRDSAHGGPAPPWAELRWAELGPIPPDGAGACLVTTKASCFAGAQRRGLPSSPPPQAGRDSAGGRDADNAPAPGRTCVRACVRAQLRACASACVRSRSHGDVPYQEGCSAVYIYIYIYIYIYLV